MNDVLQQENRSVPEQPNKLTDKATLINALLIGIQAQHAFDEKAFNFERVAEMAERAVLDYLLI